MKLSVKLPAEISVAHLQVINRTACRTTVDYTAELPVELPK
jgi:hypothetical protein